MPFLPIVKVNPSNGLIMKPSNINQSTYNTVKLINPSDTPIYYKINQQSTKCFRFYPRIGIIQPKSFSIIGVQFTPKSYKIYKSIMNICLNDMPGNSNIKIQLLGICTQPQIKFKQSQKIFFAPTSIGVFSKKQFSLQNISKNKVNIKIQVPEKYSDIISFEPYQKTLQGNQNLSIQTYFAPSLKKQYKFKVPIIVKQIPSEYNFNVGYFNPGSIYFKQQNEKLKQKIYQLQIIGQGSDGDIQLSQNFIDFGCVKITQNKKIMINIKNKSNCSFYVQTFLKNNQQNSKITDYQINNAFKLDFKSQNIPGNSNIQIGITFAPIQILNFDLQFIVHAKQKISKRTSLKPKGLQPVTKCIMNIKASGNYPQLQIIDIRNDNLSVASLWQSFNISQINKSLNTNLTSDEKMFLNIQTLTFSQAKNLQQKLKKYQWNFGYVSAKLKDKPRKVIITVKNIGGTSFDYAFKFPSDHKIQQQLWADPGQPSQQQAYQKFIIQKNIFMIKPKVGHLQPGQVKDIQLIYKPSSADFLKTSPVLSQQHKLKVIFQIQNGKSLILNLTGNTLGPNEGLISVKKYNYQLPLVPIGLLTPLRFPVQINNVGSIKVTYKAEIQYQDQASQSVFKIQNPSNFLIPGQTIYLYVQYRPLVHKKYSFKVNVQVLDFAKPIQKIQLYFIGDARQIQSKQQNSIIQSIPRQRTSLGQLGSKAFFSIQDLDFGIMKPNTIKYRMIIIYNMSKQNSLIFDFSPVVANTKTILTCGDKFSIQPSSGKIQPNSFLQIKLTLFTAKQPSIYQGQIACNIIWNQSLNNQFDNNTTVKQTGLKQKKQTLFLRLKKQTDLNNFIDPRDSLGLPNLQYQKKSLLQTIFGNIFNSVLNDSTLIQQIKSLQNQQLKLLDQMNLNTPAWQGLQIKQQKQAQCQTNNYQQYERLFLKQQFQDITQLIMQNTFFNIIQETTHKQNDFLRISKKFINSVNYN